MNFLDIYCVTNKNISFLKDKNINYKIGWVGQKDPEPGYICCNNKDNIFYKEKHYSELTFHYWYWKNLLLSEQNQWVGFCQKRRFWIKKDAQNININVNNLKENCLLFGQHVDYCCAAPNMDSMPSYPVPEVCFAGRSNVGKSSLINAISKRKNIARTSNTPGRTQLIYFYLVNKKLLMADLPGYGYAKASKSKIFEWNLLIEKYLKNRSILLRVFLLIDARHGIKENDKNMILFLNKIGINFQCILTKIDKLNSKDLDINKNKTIKELENFSAAHPEIILTSTKKNIGIDKLRTHLNLIANT